MTAAFAALPYAPPAPTDLAAYLDQFAGLQIVGADPHPEAEGCVLHLRTVGRAARRHVAIIRDGTGFHCSPVLDGSRILADIARAREGGRR